MTRTGATGVARGLPVLDSKIIRRSNWDRASNRRLSCRARRQRRASFRMPKKLVSISG